jgi:light-regulated signal transduction histidine kinase (bacteriophytochrome)
MSFRPVAFGAANLTNCDREQIHIPGSIQPHGCLLALELGELRVHHAGGAALALLGASPQALLGSPLRARIGPELSAAVNSACDTTPGARRLINLDFRLLGGSKVEATAHVNDGLLILELEPDVGRDGPPEDSFGLVQGLVAKVRQTGLVQSFLDAMAACVHEVSGFDRVMIYRFLADDSGSVEAEIHAPGMEPYLGLRYPASDIPAQARDLYLRNTLRLIPDAVYQPAPLVSYTGALDPKALDLSHSVLRSVSPLHLEYLANMGVAASMSISIVVEGRLWGLVACHHRTPRFLSSRTRAALDLFGQMASFQLETRVNAEVFAGRLRSKAIHEGLINDLSQESDLRAGLQRSSRALLDYLPAAGLALWIDGGFAAVGVTPPKAWVGRLVKWLNDSTKGGVFHTDALGQAYPPAAGMADLAAGILAISVSRSPRDYLIWFRPEQVENVRWAGDPHKPVDPSPGERISPRKSFAAWRQQIRGRSEPWNAVELRTAESLRVSLLEVVLEHVDQLARERERSRIQQDALLAELDDQIARWEATASQLKVESDRRAVVEAELSQVLRRTVVEQEEERQRIARELHDSLGQYLTTLQMDLDGIDRDRTATASIREKIRRLKTMTADAGHEVNTLAWRIRPTSLDDLGLQTALQQFLEEWSERTRLEFDLHLTLNDRRLGQATETVLYRVLQEAIHNVVKHADATRVGVILEATDTEARLIVEDDGKGFVIGDGVAAASLSSRLGLLGVRERLAIVGGTLEIETSPGRGTTLLVHVPI